MVTHEARMIHETRIIPSLVILLHRSEQLPSVSCQVKQRAPVAK
jgi:hypothetical protein